MNNRADISIQFNWIFILIAGAVLFAFFITVTVWQGNQAKQERQSRVIVQVDSILDNLQESVTNSEESFRTFTLPLTKFTQTCDEISELRITDSDYYIPLTTTILFSRTNLEAGQLNAWSINWNVPYRVAPFIFLDDGKTAYIFMNTTTEWGELQELIDEFPPELPIFVAQSDAIASNGYDNQVLIFLKDTDPSLRTFNNLDKFSAVHVQPQVNKRYTQTGEISFYQQDLTGNGLDLVSTEPFIKKEAVFGAIFSNAKQYACNMQKAITKLDKLSNIHYYKAEQLAIKAGNTGDCRNFHYTNTLNYLNDLKTTAYSTSSFSTAETASIYLDLVNKDLAYNCPEVY